MNMETLATISDIQIGYTARGRLEPMPGGVRALQLRDTTPEGGRSGEPVERFRLDGISDRYWARAGDVVFRSRGDRNTASALGHEFDEPAVAVMPLVILRAKRSVLPEYLAWFLNQPEAQHHFDKGAQGQNIRMISMSCLSKLQVPIPDIATQRTIAAIDALAQREFILSTQLAEKRRQLLSATLLRSAHESIQDQYRTNAGAPTHPVDGGTA